MSIDEQRVCRFETIEKHMELPEGTIAGAAEVGFEPTGEGVTTVSEFRAWLSINEAALVASKGIPWEFFKPEPDKDDSAEPPARADGTKTGLPAELQFIDEAIPEAAVTPEPEPEIRWVTLRLPIRTDTETTLPGRVNQSYSLHARDNNTRRYLGALFAGLHSEKATVPNGGPVASFSDLYRYIGESIAQEIETEEHTET